MTKHFPETSKYYRIPNNHRLRVTTSNSKNLAQIVIVHSVSKSNSFHMSNRDNSHQNYSYRSINSNNVNMSEQIISDIIRYQERNYGLATNKIEAIHVNSLIGLEVGDVNPEKYSAQNVINVQMINGLEDRRQNIETTSW